MSENGAFDMSKVIKLPPVPEGMSKSQWKKEWRRKQHELNKDKYLQHRREKRKKAKENRRAVIKGFKERGEEIPAEFVREPRVNVNQKDSGMRIILDCAFDDLMNEKEIISLSNQITRAYSANRRSNHFAKIEVTSFNKRLESRFKIGLSDAHHDNWPNFEFLPTEEGIIKGDNVDKSKMVYLTADTEDDLETLEAGMTYIVGGIVDKNRHKELCLNKAKELGITTKRLPLDKYVAVDGRRVLTTTHVIEIMLRYFDGNDWKQAFERTLPQRKIDITATDNKAERDAAEAEAEANEEDSDDDDNDAFGNEDKSEDSI